MSQQQLYEEIARLRRVVCQLREQLRPKPEYDGPCVAYGIDWHRLYDEQTKQLCGGGQ